MRFFCQIKDNDYLIYEETPEEAAQAAAEREIAGGGYGNYRQRLTVNVSEANEADLPLIVGDDYKVDVDPDNTEPAGKS